MSRFVVAKDIRHATLAFNNFIQAGPQPVATESKVRRAPADEPTPVLIFADPWMNFTQMTLLTVQRDGKDLFQEIKSKYQALYGNESNFVELVEDIGLTYFNIPKPRKQNNMIQEMMASLFSGGAPTGAPQIGARSSSGEDLD
jgi:hypothetical protein